MTQLFARLGPGLLFAASAVGVSHLVQSTRAGAQFGLTMAALILLACLIKYPAFRFGAEYAAATGESIIVAYERQGRWRLIFFLVAIAVEGLAVIPAVSLVAAGMTLNLLGLELSEVLATITLIVLSSIALIYGRYRLLESVCKWFVVVFAVLSVFATLAAIAAYDGATPLALPFELNRSNLNFAVAVSGWMPVGMGAAVFMSLWALARAESTAARVSVAEARFDFNIGYAATVGLALCFLFMGTLLMLDRGIALAPDSGGFAAQLIGLFTTGIGVWIGPVVAVAALAVMFSTVIAVIDGFPRVYANVSHRLLGAPSGLLAEKNLYIVWMAVQAGVALLLLSLLFSSFGRFLDFATTAGFVAAPVIAYLNHRVIRQPQVAPADQPPVWLRIWSGVAVAVLTGASLAYLYFNFI
jgi:Mn2+/Fe2+ NRAMP family transporter